ncbi:MerR family transcriptional regulator [Sulfitobacter sp.]|jgi:DNA-binding transcriptional MerR regulator|uniref:MerR family transcriptional regulator n=1 Tax=Sulfitobacter sp. TaxID=1903071 RepID=UPI000C58D573|nr:MerR family transcriptional regulator [Roseobacter sp.]MBV50096.1 MerR family transcriptional regulator [Roseobacter sp.]MBV50825.1 MerR family transcriptional regulator [Roseobacter sp.]|tara:strand:+ start:2067 stop:3152 length:1086 start_codon:yes stop_codon:yes gene_type:complete
MPKSPDAFRTISEVAEWLGIQAHVLRFWESKFTQVKPVKRAGGRRYYRPADMLLLGGIKRLLHDDGLTIKGVQKVLREEGMSHVARLSQPLDELNMVNSDVSADTIDMVVVEPTPSEQEGVVLSFEAARADLPAKSAPAQPQPPKPVDPVAAQDTPNATSVPPDDSGPARDEPDMPAPQDPEDLAVAELPAASDQTTAKAPDTADRPADEQADSSSSDMPVQDASTPETTDTRHEDLPTFLRQPMTQSPPPSSDNTPDDGATRPAPSQADPVQDQADSGPEDLDEAAAKHQVTPPLPKPRVIPDPVFPVEADIIVKPHALAAVLQCRSLSPDTAREIAPLLERLTAVRDSMSNAEPAAAAD